MIGQLHRLFARVGALFRRKQLDDELEAELEHHLELLTEEKIRAGLSAEEARRQARVALGGATQAKELHREARGVLWLEQLYQDCGYALRVFRRERAFTATALLVLTLGVGLNVTVYSLVNTTILRPLPFPHAERLYWIANGDRATPPNDLSNVCSQIGTWEGLARSSTSMETIEAFNPFSVGQTSRLTGSGEPQTVLSLAVSPGLFPLLGAQPMMGRLFLPEDAVKNAPPRVILTHQLWRRCFASDPTIVGRTIQINGTAMEVLGVMPQVDAFSSVFFPALRIDFYAALINDYERNSGNSVALIGRARPGLSAPEVDAEVQVALTHVKELLPANQRFFSANVTPLQTTIAGSLRRPLLFLWLAAGMVLAIVSLNVGGLLLARGVARTKELALRNALGAGQWRVLRQLLTECALLVGLGCAAGLALAKFLIEVLSTRSAVEIPLLQAVRLDGDAAWFAVGLCVFATLMCGLAPALRLSRAAQLSARLAEDGRSATASLGRSRLRSALVIAEVALACALAISAALVVKSLQNVLEVDLGFQPKNLIAVRIDPGAPTPHGPFLEQLLERARRLPGVEAAGVTDCIPVERDRSWGVYPALDDPSARRWSAAHVRIVTPGALLAMGVPLLEGRDFTVDDDSKHPLALIINRTLADRYWPGEKNVAGRQLVLFTNRTATIVGVAKDVRHAGPETPAGGEMYVSVNQIPYATSWDLLLRTSLPAQAAVVGLRDAMRDLDPNLPLTRVRLMQDLVDRAMSSRRLLATMIIGFAITALALALIGLYGLIAYTVTQQQKEIGIRIALGAAASLVQRQIVGRTLALAAVGVVAGVILAISVARLMDSILYGVSSRDVATYLSAVLVLLGCSLLAGYVPARRASRVDPAQALRAD